MSSDTALRVPPSSVEELEVLMGRVYALDEIQAGPALAAALAAIDADRVPGLGLTYLLQARFRQANHERGELLASVGRILNVPLAGVVPFGPGEFAADEVRAALRLTRRAATRLCDLSWDLHHRLPAVLDATRSGNLDQPRAQVFSTWTKGLSPEHTDAILFELLPTAPQLTTGELAAAIARWAIALDPEWVRRRYEAALRGRRVVGRQNPDGTGTLTGHDLPADEVAAACARLDALARAAKAAGHPDRLDHLRADLLLGLATGRFEGLTDPQILATLLTDAPARSEEDLADGAEADADDPEPDADDEVEAEDPATEPTADADQDTDGRDGPPMDDPAAQESPAQARENPASSDEDLADETPEPAGGGRVGRSGIGRRGGLRLSAGLVTVMGGDQRPADLAGWGPVHAELAVDLARRLGSWWCVLVGADGTPQTIVAIRRRPTTSTTDPGRRLVGEVWLHTDEETLRLAQGLARTGLIDPGWVDVLAEITTKLDTARAGPPNGDPTARLPGAGLRRWIHIRDTRCTFPGCRAPAHRTDTDHTLERAKGGATVDIGLAAACRHDHRLRHEGGWHVEHDQPGQITWTSRLGRAYQRHAPPGLLDLPEPRLDAIDDRDPEPPPYDPPPWADPDSCLEQEPQPPPAPILTAEPGQDDDETPPF